MVGRQDITGDGLFLASTCFPQHICICTFLKVDGKVVQLMCKLTRDLEVDQKDLRGTDRGVSRGTSR